MVSHDGKVPVAEHVPDDRRRPSGKGLYGSPNGRGANSQFVPFSPSMASEGGQPWQRQGAGPINPDYYAVPDLKVDYLVS